VRTPAREVVLGSPPLARVGLPQALAGDGDEGFSQGAASAAPYEAPALPHDTVARYCETTRGRAMVERSADWMRQAEADLRHARHALEDGDYEWSAFACHQAAEKAVKAVFQKLHLDAWGHTLSTLLASLPSAVRPSGDLVDEAKALDKHYIPTRYPNGFERGAPTDFYTREEAARAIAQAERILEFCRRQVDR
jgi:HEPN domain-containing protein